MDSSRKVMLMSRPIRKPLRRINIVYLADTCVCGIVEYLKVLMVDVANNATLASPSISDFDF